MLSNYKKVLFLGCHLDDIEFGCGGIISKFNNSSTEIYLATLSISNCDGQGNIQLVRDVDEAYIASEYLGVSKDQLYFGKCYGQVFDINRQIVREELLKLKRLYNPDAVFFSAKNDTHQDHAALSDEAFRIFRNISCFGYEVVRSSFDFFPQVYVKIDEDNLISKSNAVMSYRSQIKESAGYYFDKSIIFSNAEFRGAQAGLGYAEAFECYRAIYKSND